MYQPNPASIGILLGSGRGAPVRSALDQMAAARLARGEMAARMGEAQRQRQATFARDLLAQSLAAGQAQQEIAARRQIANQANATDLQRLADQKAIAADNRASNEAISLAEMQSREGIAREGYASHEKVAGMGGRGSGGFLEFLANDIAKGGNVARSLGTAMGDQTMGPFIRGAFGINKSEAAPADTSQMILADELNSIAQKAHGIPSDKIPQATKDRFIQIKKRFYSGLPDNDKKTFDTIDALLGFPKEDTQQQTPIDMSTFFRAMMYPFNPLMDQARNAYLPEPANAPPLDPAFYPASQPRR